MEKKHARVTVLNFLAGIVALGTLIFRIRFLHVPIDRDEGEFAYAGWRMIHGGIPYLDYYNMKMPGIYAAYALLFFLFGSTVEAIRLGLIIVNLVNAFFVYRLAETWSGKRTGFYAAICYLVFSIQVELQGTCSHAEHFAMLFVLPGFLLFLTAGEKKSDLKYFISGILFGSAFLMKQPALAFVVMAGILLIIKSASNKSGWRAKLRSFISLAFGAMLPLIITASVLFAAGAGHNFTLFAFRYAKEYISYLTFQDGWNNCIAALTAAIKPNLLLWSLVPVSLLFMLVPGDRKFKNELTAFFIFSFVAVSAGFYFRPHYFQFVLPSVAILAGSALGRWEDFWKKKNGVSNRLYLLSLPFLMLAVLFFGYSERTLFSINKDEEFIRKIYGLDFFNATQKAGSYIAENTKADSKVAIFGAEPEIWFYSKRLAASGYLYVYPLLENQKFATSMRRQFYQEIEKSKPDILLYTSNEGTWYASEDVHKEMVEWMTTYLNGSFKRIALIDMPFDGATGYYWTEDTAIHPLNEENYIEIYKRK